MLIHSSKPQWIFVAVPKTGTTSIQNFLKDKLHKKNIHVPKKWLSRYYHADIIQMINRFKGSLGVNPAHKYTNDKLIEKIKPFFKFAFHRNPWDRMVSFYHDYTTDKLHLTWSSDMLQYKNFEEFVLDFANSQWRYHQNFKPTVAYTHYQGKQIVDFIGRYDTFDRDVAYCFDQIDMPYIEFQAYERMRQAPRQKDYTQYYTSERMIQAVADVFWQDIKLFGDTYA